MSSAFGDVLRKHRLAAGLTQDQLGDRAQISSKAVSAIERGARTRPYAATVAALALALTLSGPALAEFRGLAAPRRRRTRAGPSASPERRVTAALPAYGTSYFAREDAELELSRLLAAHQLVTLIGPGGVGKTRLAAHVANELQPTQFTRALFFDCSELSEDDQRPEQILEIVLRAVRSRERERTLTAHRVLVILDCCEQAVPIVCQLIQSILGASATIGILATSRQRLRLTDECAFQLSGFAIPEVGSAGVGAQIPDAVALFRDRALARDATFSLPAPAYAAVLEICRRLEGLPLAIELAAARIGSLSIFQLRDELFRNYAILAAPHRDIADRQRSLAASIDWSLQGLTTDERQMLSRLTAFRGGFTYDAADAVAHDVATQRTSMAILASLIDKTLVSVQSDGTTARYRLPEATREFVRDNRTDAPTVAASAERHANWLATFADGADATYLRMPHGTWWSAVGPWLDDARVAVTWALGDGNNPAIAGRIIGGLRGVWRTAGLAVECRRWVEETLPLLDAGEHPLMVARLYRALAQASTGFGRVEAALRSKSLVEASGDRVALAASLTMLAEGLFEMGQYALALETVNRNAELIEALDLRDSLLYARTCYDRSLIYRVLGQPERVTPQLGVAMRIASVTGDDWVALDVRSVSADLAYDAGKTLDAISLAQEALQHARTLGWDVFVVSSLNSIAEYQLASNRVDDALGSARDALLLSRDRDALGFDTSITLLATIASLRGRHEHAALLHGFVETSLHRKTYVRPRSSRLFHDAFVTQLREGLDADSLDALSRAGRSLSENVIADLALAGASA